MRITHKHKYKRSSQRFVFDMKDYRKACQKLGQLEDIEDELGIDLITLFKKKTEVWCKVRIKGEYEIIKRLIWGINIKNKEIMVGGTYSFGSHKFSDYGKTWALTKEELEDDK